MVGMSLYGANSMAENGSSCKEILDHYFKDSTLQEK
jgi:stage II sporulation protein D